MTKGKGEEKEREKMDRLRALSNSFGAPANNALREILRLTKPKGKGKVKKRYWSKKPLTYRELQRLFREARIAVAKVMKR